LLNTLERGTTMDNNPSNSIFDVGFFVGLAIGLALGLFYAPQSGEKTRNMLREKALEIQEKAGEVVDKLS
jgi:gas vesicle protein